MQLVVFAGPKAPQKQLNPWSGLTHLNQTFNDFGRESGAFTSKTVPD
jgi:hypothetical protein